MPKVSSPGDLGIGRGAGKLGPLNLPQRRSTATPATFGAGLMEQHYSPAAFGGPTIAPQHEAAKSGFELLADTVAKVASIGSQTAEKVNDANTAAAIQQSALQASTEYTQQNLAREATIEEGADPGEYSKKALEDFDGWSAKQLEGKSGREKQALQEHLGNLKLHAMEQTTSFQATRQRQYREGINRAATATAKEAISSYYNIVLTDPGQLGAVRAQGQKIIDGLDVAEDVKIELRRDLNGGTAAAMWAGKLETDPYGTRDAMLRGDPGELAGLEADKRIAYLHGAQVDIRGLEAEARQRANEAKAEARERLQALKDDQRWAARDLHDDMETAAHAVGTGRPFDPEIVKTMSIKAERQIDAAVDPDLKYQLSQSLEAFHAAIDTSEYANVAAAIPLPQLQAEVGRLQSQGVDPNERTPESDKLITAGKILAERQDALRQGKTLEYAQEHSRTGRLDPVDWRDPQSSVVREEQSTKIAYLNGLPHGGDHQRLTEPEAAHIAEDINSSATTDEAFAKINGYMGRLDDNARRVWIRELKAKKLSPMVERAMEALYDRNDMIGARAVVGAMTVKPDDLPKFGDAKADAIKEAVNAKLTNPGNLASLSSIDARNTQQPGVFERSAEDRDALLRMTQYYVQTGQDATTAADSAEKALFGDGPTSGNDDLQYVRPPKGEDPGEFTTLLERVRATAILPEYAYGSAEERLYRGSNLENIRNNGWFRQGPGGTYELVDPTTQRTVATFTASQLRAAAVAAPSAPTSAIELGVPAP